MSAYRSNYTPAPARPERSLSPVAWIVLAVVLGPLLVALAVAIAALLTAPASTGCSQPTLLRAVDTL